MPGLTPNTISAAGPGQSCHRHRQVTIEEHVDAPGAEVRQLAQGSHFLVACCFSELTAPSGMDAGPAPAMMIGRNSRDLSDEVSMS